jgi:hypothetical protein
MPVVIGGFVSAAALVVRGLFWEPVQKRIHPISDRHIVIGRRNRMTAFLRARMFLGRVKIMPGYS